MECNKDNLKIDNSEDPLKIEDNKNNNSKKVENHNLVEKDIIKTKPKLLDQLIKLDKDNNLNNLFKLLSNLLNKI